MKASTRLRIRNRGTRRRGEKLEVEGGKDEVGGKIGRRRSGLITF